MAAPVFTPLPSPPNREQSPETFSSDADAFLGALPAFQTQGNSLGTFCETQATNAETAASLISSSITVFTNETAFNAATPATGELYILSI